MMALALFQTAKSGNSDKFAARSVLSFRTNTDWQDEVEQWDEEAFEQPVDKQTATRSDLLTVTPNPANDEVWVALSGEPFSAVLYTLQGEIVLPTQKSTGNPMKLFVRDLPAGIYLLRCQTTDALHVAKLVIAK